MVQNVDAERKALVKFISVVKGRRSWTFRLLVDIHIVHLENLHIQTSDWKAARTPSMAGRCAGCRGAMTFLRPGTKEIKIPESRSYPFNPFSSLGFKWCFQLLQIASRNGHAIQLVNIQSQRSKVLQGIHSNRCSSSP